MPEGDTVWHTAAILRDGLVGKTLTRCDVRVPKYATVDLSGHVVDEVISRGKHLFIRVGPASIHSHLKMEASWKVNPVSKPSKAGYRIRIILETADIQAAFHSPRKRLHLILFSLFEANVCQNFVDAGL